MALDVDFQIRISIEALPTIPTFENVLFSHARFVIIIIHVAFRMLIKIVSHIETFPTFLAYKSSGFHIFSLSSRTLFNMPPQVVQTFKLSITCITLNHLCLCMCLFMRQEGA